MTHMYKDHFNKWDAPTGNNSEQSDLWKRKVTRKQTCLEPQGDKKKPKSGLQRDWTDPSTSVCSLVYWVKIIQKNWNSEVIPIWMIWSALIAYFDASNMWVLWWSDRGLMLYCRTWQVLGWILGVTYACKVPYCPSIDLIWYKTQYQGLASVPGGKKTFQVKSWARPKGGSNSSILDNYVTAPPEN